MSLRTAIVTVAAGDDQAGGLVELTGRSFPVVYARTFGPAEVPLVTFFLVADNEGTSVTRRLVVAQFTAWGGPSMGATYIEDIEAILDRVVEVMSSTNMAALGVDTAPVKGQRRDIPADEDGIVGINADITFYNTEEG